MAEAPPPSAEPVKVPQEGDAKNPKAAQSGAHPPGAEAVDNPEWALKLLARVARKAAEQNVLSSVPRWIYSQQRIDYTTGAVSAPENGERDAVLKVVIDDLVRAGKLSATAAQTPGERWRLYRDCATLGNVIIEGTAADRCLNVTLENAKKKILGLLNDAARLWDGLHQAAGLVVNQVQNTRATVRDPDLDAVFHPNNLRLRDGTPADRITRIRYIQAVRSLVERARTATASPVGSPADPVREGRGLTPVRLDRGTAPSPRPTPQDRLLSQRPALEFLIRVAMHPNLTGFVGALNGSAAAGRNVFIAMVADAVNQNGKLAERIRSNTRRIWRFPAALRFGMATINERPSLTHKVPAHPTASSIGGPRVDLTVTEIDALTQYALRIAPEMKTSSEEALDALGNLVTVIELFGGPFAPIGVIADVIIQSAGAAVSFMQQLDQDRAESSTIFEKESKRLSSGGRYLGPIAQGVGALLAAAELPGALKKIAAGKSMAPAPARADSTVRKSAESADVPKTATEGPTQVSPGEGEKAIASRDISRPSSGKLSEPPPATPSPDSKPHVEVPEVPAFPKKADEPKLAKFEGPDIAKPTKEEVDAARSALRAELDAMVKQGIIDAPRFDDLVMSVPQEDTFARLNGVLLSSGRRAVPEGLSPARTAARQLAENRAIDLRQRLATHWDAALPGRGKKKLTAAEAAGLLYKELTKDPPTKGTLNAAVRDSLYDNWRGRFIDLVSEDKDLVGDLKEWAGVTFTPPGSKVTAFRVQAIDSKGNLSWVDLNWDHAFRHEDAVERAFRTGDSTWLIPTVDSANLAPNTARENQTFKEAINRQNERGWTIAPGPTPRATQPFP